MLKKKKLLLVVVGIYNNKPLFVNSVLLNRPECVTINDLHRLEEGIENKIISKIRIFVFNNYFYRYITIEIAVRI